MSLYFRLLFLFLGIRNKPRIAIWDTGIKTFRVLPNDLDALGHMNNGRYLTLMDLGRMDLMMRSGYWQRLVESGWYPVVAGQTITYRRSLNPFQKYELHTRMLGHDDHGSYVEQTFCVGDEIYAIAYVRARFLKKAGGKVSNEEIAQFMGDDVPESAQIPEWVSEWGKQNRTLPQNR